LPQSFPHHDQVDEQSTDDWWTAVIASLQSVGATLERQRVLVPVVLSVTSTSGTVVPLNDDYRFIHNALMYSDKRPLHETAELADRAPSLGANISWALPKILWFGKQFLEIAPRRNRLEPRCQPLRRPHRCPTLRPWPRPGSCRRNDSCNHLFRRHLLLAPPTLARNRRDHRLPPQPPHRRRSRLIEIDFGTWEDLTRSEIQTTDAATWSAWRAAPETAAGSTGETGRAAANRFKAFAVYLTQTHSGETVLAVGHNTLNRLFLADLLGMPLRNNPRLVQDNAGLTIVEIEAEGVVVRRMNVVYAM
jgi:broad specificity phosphatase PhoE